jgi:hypothetical protein
MSQSQTSFFVCNSSVNTLAFPSLLGATRNTDIYQMNCIEAVVPQLNDKFLVGQSKILGFKRIISSPDPADNGTPYLCNYAVDVQFPSPVIVGGTTTQIQVYNPFRVNTLILTSSSDRDTSRYTMYWVNEYANDDVAQSLGLVSQKVFPDPNRP